MPEVWVPTKLFCLVKKRWPKASNYSWKLLSWFLGLILHFSTSYFKFLLRFPVYIIGGISGKEPACQCRRCKRHGFSPWVRKIPWRRNGYPLQWASQVALVVKNLSANAGDVRDMGSLPGSGRWQPTPVFLPGESHGQRSLAGYSP